MYIHNEQFFKNNFQMQGSCADLEFDFSLSRPEKGLKFKGMGWWVLKKIFFFFFFSYFHFWSLRDSN